ncbi:MAG: hypothetical protein HUU20_13270 [Pirellulales bacterium]|nr:hypothetical protein [Pirellulales bacterium]
MTEDHRAPPLQFRLRSLLAMAVAVCLIFGTLRWLNVPPRASLIVLVILAVSVAAAVALVAAIAGSDR